MKKQSSKPKSVVKGAPSGFVVSLAIHAAAFILAGMLVVFNVVKKEEKKFVPPKAVERPKMKLKKPKVKVKKSAKPKSTTRIVTKVNRASMPDIQLPELSGLADGLAGGIGGFDIIPDIDEGTLFGGTQTVGNDFVGTFYDFNRDRSGKSIPMDPDTMFQHVKNFMVRGWKPSVLARFYRSPQKLYNTFFCVPTVHSSLGPTAFGHPESASWCWLVHYKGQLVHPEDITFRFWGQGDDHMIVRVNGEVVLSACWPQSAEPHYAAVWTASSADSRKYPLGNNLAVVGDWITLKAGEPMDMEVLIGEGGGGLFAAILAIEEEGVEYPKNRFMFGPTLPIFQTETIKRDLVEAIETEIHEGEVSINQGPIFKDYVSKSAADSGTPEPNPETDATVSEPEVVKADPLRIWTSVDGKTIEAEYMTLMGRNQAVLKTARGKQIKMAVSQLSDEDREFIELMNPPKFDVEFIDQYEQIIIQNESPFNDLAFPRRTFDYDYGVRVKQKDTVVYNHELKVEYFAIGKEVDGDNRVLIDRGVGTFTPATQKNGTYVLRGETVRVDAKATWEQSSLRGVAHDGYLVVITNKRGDIVYQKTNRKVLYNIIDKLRDFPVGKHFNDEGERVSPPRPMESDRNPFIF